MITKIDKEQLHMFRPPDSSIQSLGTHDELYGYLGVSGDAHGYAGTVLLDKIDNNYSYVLFKRVNGIFEYVDGSVDFATEQEADEELRQCLMPMDIEDNLLERSRKKQLYVDLLKKEVNSKQTSNFLMIRLLNDLKATYELQRQHVEQMALSNPEPGYAKALKTSFKRQYDQVRNMIKNRMHRDDFIYQVYDWNNEELTSDNLFLKAASSNLFSTRPHAPDDRPYLHLGVEEALSLVAQSEINLMSVDLANNILSGFDRNPNNRMNILNHMPSNPFYIEFDRCYENKYDLSIPDSYLQRGVVGIMIARASSDGFMGCLEKDLSDYEPVTLDYNGQHLIYGPFMKHHSGYNVTLPIFNSTIDADIDNGNPMWLFLALLDYCANVHIDYVHVKGQRKKKKPKHQSKNKRESVVKYHYREERSYKVNRFDDDDIDYIINTIIIPGMNHKWLYCPNCNAIHKWSLLRQLRPCRNCGFVISMANVVIKKRWHPEYTVGSGPLKETVREHRHIKK